MRTGCDLSAAKLFERFAADELPAAEVHGEVEAGLHWVDGFAELVAVERHRGFEAERVAGAEAGGHAANFFGSRNNLLPNGRGVFVFTNYFKAISRPCSRFGSIDCQEHKGEHSDSTG